jgi:hypothetical protein
MVYLAGDSVSLASAMEEQFKDLSRVGSTREVNIIVQWDRPGEPHPCAPDKDLDNPQWKETLRFRVTKGMCATRRTAYRNLCEQDMADGATLADFVTDTQRRFPAHHYALVMSGHGFGFQLQLAQRTKNFHGKPRTIGPSRLDSLLAHFLPCCSPEPSVVGGAPYRSGTTDETSGDVLYNRALADALEHVLRRPLDLLVFDECGMGMIETAYAVKRVARIMVASEALIPGRGTRMDYWLKPLTFFPWMSAPTVSALVVHTYQATIFCSPSYTMSAVDTAHIASLSNAVSLLAAAMIDELPTRAAEIVSARREVRDYDAEFEPGRIDLELFCTKLIVKSSSWRIRWRALRVIIWLRLLRVANGPSIFSAPRYGSQGLSIYFPIDGQTYCADGSAECGYEHCNPHEPVKFVNEAAWSDFLHRYFAVFWSNQAEPDPLHPHLLPATCEALHECAFDRPFEMNTMGCDR